MPGIDWRRHHMLGNRVSMRCPDELLDGLIQGLSRG